MKSKKLKIGFVVPYFHPLVGGAETNIYNLATGLAKKHEVHVFTKEIDKQENLPREETHKGVKIHRFPITLKGYYFSLYPSLGDELSNHQFDVLHIVGFGFIQQDIILMNYNKGNTKIVNTPHGPFMALQNYPLHKRIIKSLYLAFLRPIYKKYDLVFEINPEQRKWMLSDYNLPDNKVKLLPPGIEKSAFKPIKSALVKKVKEKYKLNDRFIISYLGRIQQYKGIDQIIKALPEALKINNKITLVCIGRDVGDQQRLIGISKELNIEKNVIFTGPVSEEEKLALLDLSEIFVFPSEWEAFGIAMLEAMARGNACISTKTEGGLFLIKDKINGFLYDYQNVSQLSEKLNILLSNNKLRNKMQSYNIKKAKDFLWNRIINDQEKAYLNLLKQK